MPVDDEVPSDVKPKSKYMWFPQHVCFAACGGIIGLAWQEAIPAPVGLLGLGLFFLLQVVIVPNLIVRLLGAVLTGVVANAVACFWMPDSIAYLAKCETLAATATAVLVYFLQSLPYLSFASACHFVRSEESRWLLIPVIWFVSELLVTPILP
ncbi:MAG: hypothetical protein AAF497_20630, partial [Planctomycetota bacterium]